MDEKQQFRGKFALKPQRSKNNPLAMYMVYLVDTKVGNKSKCVSVWRNVRQPNKLVKFSIYNVYFLQK